MNTPYKKGDIHSMVLEEMKKERERLFHALSTTISRRYAVAVYNIIYGKYLGLIQ